MSQRKFVVTTDSNHARRIYPKRVPDLVLTEINQLWIADLTYIRLAEEFVFLAAILDAFSRRVIGWALDRRLDDELTLTADHNTRHPMKGVGLNRIRVAEYPVEALREALVNAVAHRQYEDAGRKIMLEVVSDWVVISSPGMPPAPITLANLRKEKYRPCSRNPVLAQCLSYFHRIEERAAFVACGSKC